MKKLSQSKGLRFAAAGVALMAASSLAVPVAGAAKGGNGGKGGQGQVASTPTLVSSSYGLIADGGTYGGTALLSIVDKTTGQALPALSETVRYEGTCSQNGALVGSFGSGTTTDPTLTVTNRSMTWTGGAADCSANLWIVRNGTWSMTATVTYRVAA